MPIKQPLYPHVPKIKAKGGGRIDYDKILSALDYFIKDEQKAAKEYRDFVDRLHSMSVMEGYSEILFIARDEDRHKAKLEDIRKRIQILKHTER